MLSEYAKQLGAFVTLVVVQSMAILLFKLCQQDGKYTFNPASSVALTEICKLGLAGSLHYSYVSQSKKCAAEGRPCATPARVGTRRWQHRVAVRCCRRLPLPRHRKTSPSFVRVAGQTTPRAHLGFTLRAGRFGRM